MTTDKLTLPPPAKSAADLIAATRAERYVVEDFRPSAESIEWELGRLFYQERGSQAFQTTDHVPFEINNDGTLSQHAAEVFFANLVACEASQPAGATIFALEIGPGTGLFARFLLDAFRELCQEQKKDFYDRLCLVLADSSEQMLADIDKGGVLGPHRERCRFVHADARDIARALAAGDATGAVGPLSAVFLNYILDSLPAALLEFEGDVVKELRVRTCLARNFNTRNALGLTPESIAQRASSGDAAARRTLIDLYPYFTLDYDYFPVESGQIALVEFARSAARAQAPAVARPAARLPLSGLNDVQVGPSHVLHSYAAIQCLQACLGLLSSEGFILINDQGPTALDDPADGIVYKTFSGATCIALNFALLGEFFRGSGECQWVEPATDRDAIQARLLGREPTQPAIDLFRERFDKATDGWLNEPVGRARQLQQWGQHVAALGAYQEALVRRPRNWQLMDEAAKCLMFATRDFASALRLAATAISLNPRHSAELWDTLGDAYLGLEMADSAAAAFQRALAIDATNVRARLGLAHVYLSRGDYAEALRTIADAITLDKTRNTAKC